METIRTLKAFLARLAGAPLPSQDEPILRKRRAGQTSGGCAEALPSSPQGRTTKQRDGDEAEAFARRRLERAGLTFVAANVRFRDGEIDLVMRDPPPGRAGSSVLVFVEVRRRACGSYGGAAGSITRAKRRRVMAAASHYLAGLGLRAPPPCRFDVVTIEGDVQRGFRVDWIHDAFREDG